MLDKFDEDDGAAFDTLRQFDPEMKLPQPPRHDLYTAALKGEREARAMIFLQQQLHDGCAVYDGGRIIARGDTAPDKPGTVRSPGTRRVSHRKARWAIFSGQ